MCDKRAQRLYADRLLHLPIEARAAVKGKWAGFKKTMPRRSGASQRTRDCVVYCGRGPVGIMMCAYGVPFHITYGPPELGSVDMPSNIAGSGTMIMTCGPSVTH